ncbi:virulence factor [Pollutimonas nitritireducens]|uniref:Virulence factor n=1 Tax=Pollutimonas nitritireducens TaxID=2045209 RepID=A0A2N4UDB9_9BURK|nr:virulence factor [Pollutimonas nitritireducens]PLC53004.1 virulence factor [Pollutimonas nitritireducens]
MKRLLLAGAATLAMLGSSAAMARVDVDISIGVPGVIYSEPDYYYPPVRYVERPRVIVVPERRYHRPVTVYGPRYYREDYRDGRHYRKHHNKHHGKHHSRRGHRDD